MRPRLELSRAQRVLWLLEELQVPYQLKVYKRGSDWLADPALRNVHPLGKSPVVTVQAPGSPQSLVLAESAAITEYLCDYYGKWLVPRRYVEGKEGQVGGETESWLRYRHYMHYAEGSIMPLVVVSFLVDGIKNGPVPFFIRPITNAIAGKISKMFLQANFETHYKFLESQLETSPQGGGFLCGPELTAADILMSFPLLAGEKTASMSKDKFPRVWQYVQKLHETDGYKRSVKKIEELGGDWRITM